MFPRRHGHVGHCRACGASSAQLAALGVPRERVYLDKGLTGSSRARPGLDQALAAVATTGGLCRGVGRRRLRRAAPTSLAGGSHENASVIVPAGAAASVIP